MGIVGWADDGEQLAAFYLLEFIIDRDLPNGPWFLLFAGPGFFFLLAWYLSPRGDTAT
jgi:hypothetical protein